MDGPMRVGMIGTGAISHKHAQAYRNIGYEVTACTDINEAYGRAFAEKWGGEFVSSYEEVCRHPRVDYVDVCTFPDFRLQPIEICAETKKHVQVQKPISTNLETARRMIETAARGGIVLGVVSQHRFDDASLFLSKALAEGRLGKLLQCDAYVKWYRSAEYYSRPIKGSWKTEGGGALMNQAIHQVDLMRWFAGPVQRGLRRVAIGRAAQDRVGRRGERGGALRERRYRRDPGSDGVLAGVSRAHGVPRHQRHGGDLGRQADRLGRGERFRRPGAGDEGRRLRARATRWRFRSSPLSGSSSILARRYGPAGNRSARARMDIRRWRLWMRCIDHAARDRKWFCRFRKPSAITYCIPLRSSLYRPFSLMN